MNRFAGYLLLCWLVIAVPAVLGQGTATDRYKSFLFGVDYYPEQWPESMWESDARRMKECGVKAVRIGEFAWALMEPREGTFDFSLFDRAIETLSRHDLKIIIGTPTATPPKWLTRKYPEVLYVLPDRQPANDQSRRHINYNSPVYRRLSKRIVSELVGHYRNSRQIIGWQIDNEFNNENPEAWSESDRSAFRDWLRAKYATLDELNRRWGTIFWSQTYTDWSQVDLPYRTTALHNPALMLDYKRFISDSVTSYMEDQIEIIRRQRPNDFITQNGVFRNIDYYRFSRNTDIHSSANYPLFTDVPQYSTGASLTAHRSYLGRFMVMEQQTGAGGQTYLLRSPRPGEMRLWTFQSIAHGADGIVHFRWRSALRGIEQYWQGVLDQDDVPRARFEEFRREGLEIDRIGPEIFGSRIVSEIAVLRDFENEWAYEHQFMTSEVRPSSAYGHLFRAASELKYNIDFIGPEAEFSGYRIVFAPYHLMMDERLADRMRSFVEGGGVLIMTAHGAVKDRDNAMTGQTPPIMGLTGLFGVEVDSFNAYQPPSREKNGIRFADGTIVPVHVFAETLKPAGAKVVAVWDRDYMRGAPAVTEREHRQGRAVYFGSFFNLESARYLLGHYASLQNLRPLFTGFPDDIEVTRRSKGDRHFYFILNHRDESVELSVGDGFFDILEGKSSASTIKLPPFGYKILRQVRKTQ